MAERVLLCDDEIQIIRAAEFKIKRAGYEVSIACDGLEALEMIEANRPDIVVTDCQMPRLDGLGLVGRLRENPATADLPVLMLSAKGFELDDRYLMQTLRVSQLIAKPFSPRELLASIQRVLEDDKVDRTAESHESSEAVGVR